MIQTLCTPSLLSSSEGRQSCVDFNYFPPNHLPKAYSVFDEPLEFGKCIPLTTDLLETVWTMLIAIEPVWPFIVGRCDEEGKRFHQLYWKAADQ